MNPDCEPPPKPDWPVLPEGYEVTWASPLMVTDGAHWYEKPDDMPLGEFPWMTRQCDHRWRRLPVVDFSVVYQCQECERALQISWLAAAGGTLDDLDRAFEAKYGGQVCRDPADREPELRTSEG